MSNKWKFMQDNFICHKFILPTMFCNWVYVILYESREYPYNYHVYKNELALYFCNSLLLCNNVKDAVVKWYFNLSDFVRNKHDKDHEYLQSKFIHTFSHYFGIRLYTSLPFLAEFYSRLVNDVVISIISISKMNFYVGNNWKSMIYEIECEPSFCQIQNNTIIDKVSRNNYKQKNNYCIKKYIHTSNFNNFPIKSKVNCKNTNNLICLFCKYLKLC